MQITGVTGRLLLGGRPAAELGTWECDVTGPDQVGVQARLLRVDAFLIEEAGPFCLKLPWGDQEQIWRTTVILDRSETHIQLEARGRQPHA